MYRYIYGHQKMQIKKIAFWRHLQFKIAIKIRILFKNFFLNLNFHSPNCLSNLITFFFNQGVTYPACHGIWRHWAPPIERSKLATSKFEIRFFFAAFVTTHLSGFSNRFTLEIIKLFLVLNFFAFNSLFYRCIVWPQPIFMADPLQV